MSDIFTVIEPDSNPNRITLTLYIDAHFKADLYPPAVMDDIVEHLTEEANRYIEEKYEV